MLKKAPSKDAKELADEATEAFEQATGERAAFDLDIDNYAEAAFRRNQSLVQFIKLM